MAHELIKPNDPGHGMTQEDFGKLVRNRGGKSLEKLVEHLAKVAPDAANCAGFIAAVESATIGHLWLYYQASLPEKSQRRSKLKKDTRKAADLAEKLAEITDRLLRHSEVNEVLSEFVNLSPPKDGLPANFFEPGFTTALRVFARKCSLLEQTLPADRGGNSTAAPFKALMSQTAGMFSDLTGQPAAASTRGEFFEVAARVREILAAIAPSLPSAKFDFPPEAALAKALARLATETQPA